MPTIFQIFRHLFLELFCAKAALKVQYVYHSRTVRHDYVYHSRTVRHDYVYHSKIVTSMADGRPYLHCLSLHDDARIDGTECH
jgi:hypothetical protein